MANLASLVHELRERIAASSCPPKQGTDADDDDDEDPLETRFRTVLPNLLHAYVIPSSSANEREVTAVLKLLSYTARNFAGVFFHGRADAVLPVIGRVIPFFAEPAFRSRHGVIFEAVGSLLSLLRTGDREAYRQFFFDSMLVVEDLVSVASLQKDKPGDVASSRVLLKCFHDSFSGISSFTSSFSEVPVCCRPTDGVGVMIDLTGKSRWQPFATWMIKLISKCLTEGTLNVEGLVNSVFMTSTCTLLCFGDAALHMACFDFACITTTVLDAEIIPKENLIRSITAILDHNKEEKMLFRNTAYDSSIGACLHVVHSSSDDYIVESTASDIVDVFPMSVRNTESTELKVALCGAYTRIAKVCPPNIWKPRMLINMLCLSKPCIQLIDCIRATVDILGIELIGHDIPNDNGRNLSPSSGKGSETNAVGEKRQAQDMDCVVNKRLKTEGTSIANIDVREGGPHTGLLTCEQNTGHATGIRELFFSFFGMLELKNLEAASLSPNTALVAVSMLCIIFSNHHSSLSIRIFQLMISWMPWICQQANKSSSLMFDLAIYLEAVHSMVLLHGMKSFGDGYGHMDDTGVSNSELPYHSALVHLLKLPWTHSLIATQAHPLWKTKCLSVQLFSMLKFETDLEFLDLALKDEAEEVRFEAIISMPLIVMFSGHGQLTNVLNRLEFHLKDKHDQVRSIIPVAVGYLLCLLASSNAIDNPDNGSCTLFINNHNGRQVQTLDLLSRGFWCPRCDRKVIRDRTQFSTIIHMQQMHGIDANMNCDFSKLQSILFQLLTDEAPEEVELTCVRMIPRFLRHSSRDFLLRTRHQWNQCIEYLLLHKKKAVREAFSSQIYCFLEDQILDCLFVDEECTTTKEQIFLDKIKHSLKATEDPHVLETLLDSTVEIMNAIDLHRQLFSDSFILLVDHLDNPHLVVRMTASRLINKSCYFHLNGGLDLLLSKFVHIRDRLFDYLSVRVVTQPNLIREFAEGVLGIRPSELIGKMVPVVIPKLVVSQQVDDQAVTALHELAKNLSTDVVPLTVDWLPKVLAFALLRENEQELASALQFYHTQTGSESKEIFAAALPALLDELVCFQGDGDINETNRRVARIPLMIKRVAGALTSSDNLPSFLKNHFVRLLNSIDRKMLHADDLMLQRQSLKRIEKLIEMMGSFLSAYVPKIMVLLIYAVEKDALQSDGLMVLHFFVKQLAKLSPSSTRHVLSQLVAAFIPCIERFKESPSMHLNKVVEILEELILENSIMLKQEIRELPLLPSIPALTKVNSIIQEARGSMTLRDQLRNAVNGLNHESLNVRYMMACELSKLLNLKREEITSLIAGEAVSDLDIVSSLITSLLRGCAEQSRTVVGQRLKLVCADCLGAFGAIDPAKFKGIPCQRFKIKCSDDDLIFELIHNYLTRAFRAASDTIVQDSAALAIQELLKLAGCQASLDENAAVSANVFEDGSKDRNLETNNRGQRLWDRFSNYVRDIIAPCLTSRFQLPSVMDSTSIGPIYKPSMSFRRWIYFWIKKLTIHATGSRASIFNACRGIVRHDMQTAVYLLPYLVLNAVCNGTAEARQGITEEILSVLKAAAMDNGKPVIQGVSGGQSEVCIQAVFTLLDNLGQWVDDLRQEAALARSLNSSVNKQTPKGRGQMPETDQLFVQCGNVSELLSAIPKVTLARASFHCQAYARSLRYFESHVQEKSGSFNPAAERSGVFADEDISFLMEIYSGLDEPDGLSGLANLRKSLNLHDQLLINEKVGNWGEVLTSCEQALQMEPTSIQRHSGVLNCLLNMCLLQAMVTHVDGLISRIPQYKKAWCMQGVQAAWRLGRWELMDEYLSGADEEGLVCGSSPEISASFDMDLAKILQAMMKKDSYAVSEKIAQSKQALLVPLAAAGMDSYMRAYPFIVKLHMLCELEDFHALLGDESFLDKTFHLDDPNFAKVMNDWDNRLRFTQPSLWAREPLLAFRRLVFNSSSIGAQVGNCWLQYAKLCRSAGHYETANRAIIEAQASGALNVHIEKAKMLWSSRRSDCAIAELQHSLQNVPAEVLGPSCISSLASLSLVPPNQPSLCAIQASNENWDVARTILLYTRWIHYTGQKQKEDVINLFTRVRELQPKWEKGFFYAAKYYDDLLMDARKRQEDSQEGLVDVDPRKRMIISSIAVDGSSTVVSAEEKPWWTYLSDVLLFYARGLHRGHKHLFQALPRLLTLWFEFGSRYNKDTLSSNKALKAVHGRVTCIMRGCLKDLPTYQWLTVLSQLVSRICHQNEDVVRIVKQIITSVLQEYPQQALWMMAAVSKSTVSARRDAASEIIQAARKGSRQGSDNHSLFIQFAGLIEHLIKLCFHQGQSKARTVNISTEFSALKRMMPLGIIMPIQQALTVNMPSYDKNLTNPPILDIFSSADLATISGITDEAEILSSLQKPKKVVFIGSDGVQRPFLCKPKDDLRKDARMMEFTAMINRLLSKFPESRRRKLYIRTFAVIPLTEDCGMVEWVPHTRGLRHILQDIYIASGKFDRQKTNPMIKRMYDQCQASKMPDHEMLKTKILPMFPPVFHKWFLTTFSEPAAWFRARVAYAHTTAVWSMVGHIVGLGDRHGENILFDSTTGDCVHVDFSCLFDKGLQLEKPELVPFRLTQNMIDGLGITGYEGIFMKVCEITLTVLRTHRETLMSVLETFIHDPLVEWTKSHKSSGVEVQNPHAQRAISNIKARLQGVVVGVGAAPSLPLAVEGQVRRLIAEAVSHKNLGKMYIWWMPWF
ncbi:Serine/threonine-protein kinase ATR [Acorus gramineus]|uniref:Serine/threonine-protein kinase ATR n=1 Tax=Acorus gramineus TaxID=55184 RepID=A0AAV9BBA6_ACOGR|nr:Serine/threonine-protein kinase ATR [Acorus gramineus]